MGTLSKWGTMCGPQNHAFIPAYPAMGATMLVISLPCIHLQFHPHNFPFTGSLPLTPFPTWESGEHHCFGHPLVWLPEQLSPRHKLLSAVGAPAAGWQRSPAAVTRAARRAPYLQQAWIGGERAQERACSRRGWKG